jgi:hypothetical protein
MTDGAMPLGPSASGAARGEAAGLRRAHFRWTYGPVVRDRFETPVRGNPGSICAPHPGDELQLYLAST